MYLILAFLLLIPNIVLAEVNIGPNLWSATAQNIGIGTVAADGMAVDIFGKFRASELWGNGANLTGLPLPSMTPAVATRSITSACNANGWQVHATKPAMVSYTVRIATTATIGGSAEGSIVLKTAPTNSSTAGDWVEAGRLANAQAISLAIVLQSVQTSSAPLFAMIPAGYYACLQSVTASGSPTYAYVTGQETVIG